MGILSPLELMVVIARVILFLGAGTVLGWLVTEGLYALRRRREP